MASLLATCLFMTSMLKTRDDRFRGIMLLLITVWLCKLLAAGVLLKPFALFQWINPHLVTGLAAGFLLTWWVAGRSRLTQTWCAIFALILVQAASTLWPLSEVQSDFLSLFRWPYGHLLNMSALLDFLSDLWPAAALACLLLSLWQQRQS